ncbi:hypothetical protein Fot_34337 [Forsythia ovata]|uniref:Uncharacterized protein n=1 Tax=Forsythia ovata TaxID=205694 RepID=A0ABD1SJV4_9LAMI
MKVDELCYTVVGAEDIDAMRLENQILCSELTVSVFEDTKARAIYDITKSRTIQNKELTEALAELSKANELLANLGVLGYADPKDPAGTYVSYSSTIHVNVAFPDFRNVKFFFLAEYIFCCEHRSPFAVYMIAR